MELIELDESTDPEELSVEVQGEAWTPGAGEDDAWEAASKSLWRTIEALYARCASDSESGATGHAGHMMRAMARGDAAKLAAILDAAPFESPGALLAACSGVVLNSASMSRALRKEIEALRRALA